MKYALEILQTHLRNEIIAQNDAVNYFMGTHAYDNKVGSEATRAAFQESKRLAEERIPQLTSAINLITINFDQFTNDVSDQSTGKRPAIQHNVTG